jgi:hypothetical protein
VLNWTGCASDSRVSAPKPLGKASFLTDGARHCQRSLGHYSGHLLRPGEIRIGPANRAARPTPVLFLTSTRWAVRPHTVCARASLYQ